MSKSEYYGLGFFSILMGLKMLVQLKRNDKFHYKRIFTILSVISILLGIIAIVLNITSLGICMIIIGILAFYEFLISHGKSKISEISFKEDIFLTGHQEWYTVGIVFVLMGMIALAEEIYMLFN